jgi:hemerythrin
MSSLRWNHRCCAGVQSMDDQHGTLLDALNELHSGSADPARIRVLVRLHVEAEERLLALHNFPEIDAYRAEHQLLLERVDSFSASALVSFLREWFSTHAEAAGGVYGPWLTACGVR